MKGVGRTILQLLRLSSSLQAWMLGIGLILTAVGLCGLLNEWLPAFQGLWVAPTLLGVATTVAAPVVLDPLMFRSISAPRSMELIPNARLKLVAGALGSQLLLSVFIGTSVGTMLSFGNGPYVVLRGGTPVSLMAAVSIIVYVCLTLHFIGFYWASQFKLGGLWVVGYALWPRLIAVSPASWRTRELFTTTPGLSASLAISLVAWLAFAVAYVRARHIRALSWGSPGAAMSAARAGAIQDTPRRGPQQYSQRQAIRTVLLGSAPYLRRQTVFQYVAGILLLGLIMLATTGRASAFGWLPWVTAVGILTSLIPGIHAGWMTLRARLLWLTSGLGRDQLFREAELCSWRMLGIVAGIALTVEAPLFAFGGSAGSNTVRLASILAMPLISGAAFVYMNLLGVPRRRLSFFLITMASSTVILTDFLFSLTDVAPSRLPALVAAQAILVPVLRSIAHRRWQNMDWMINKSTNPVLRFV